MNQLTLDSLKNMSREDAIKALEYLINMDFHLNSPIIEIPNFIPDSDCDYIREKLRKYMDDNPDKIFDASVRIGKSLTISKIPELEEIEKYLYENFSKKIYEQILSKSLYYEPFIEEIGDGVSDNGYDFHHYNDLECCIPHFDNIFHHPGRTEDFNEKVYIFASCSLCLNTPKTGGELIFPHMKKTVKSEKGKVTIWSPHPFYKHYTTPTENDYRDIIVTWMQSSTQVVISNDDYDKLLKNTEELKGLQNDN